MIPLGMTQDNKVAKISYNSKSEIFLIVAPRGGGKTSLAKRILSYDIKYLGKETNRKYLIIDSRGVDWRTMKYPQGDTRNLLEGERPFKIDRTKCYTPLFDQDKKRKGDILFGLYPGEMGFKDWLTFTKFTETGAWELVSKLQQEPEKFDSPEKLINYIKNLPESMKQAMIKGTDEDLVIDGRTKRSLIRQLAILQESNAMVAKDSIHRKNKG